MIEELAALIDPQLRNRSGKVFYSGREAFSVPSDLYVLGLNPGGDAHGDNEGSIALETHKLLTQLPAKWSAYCDESWRGKMPGTDRMQPRVLHMLRQIGRDPRLVPSSNLIFVRSNRESGIKNEQHALEDLCWPFHEAVIQKLRPRVVLCFGRTAANAVRARLGAHDFMDAFIETNNRRWKSEAFVNQNGIAVIRATHPSIVDWTQTASDPTPLVRGVLERLESDI